MNPVTATSREYVAATIVIDPQPGQGGPRVLLVANGDNAWTFPHVHVSADEALSEAALHAVDVHAGLIVDLWTPDPLVPIAGRVVLEQPWRIYQIPAPAAPEHGPDQPAQPRHHHIVHYFLAIADSTIQVRTSNPGRAVWHRVVDLPGAPDIRDLMLAAVDLVMSRLQRKVNDLC